MKRAALLLLLLAALARGDKIVAIPQGGIRIMGGGSIIFGGATTDSVAAAPTTVPTLRWKNGETLPGDLVGSSENDLTWKSSLFDDPLQLRWDVIDRIDWPGTPQEPKDPFAIALRDGSFLYGDLVSVTADSITIHGMRHGDAVLKRSEVLSIRRRQNAKLVYGGPNGDLHWDPMINQQDGSVTRNPDDANAASPVVTGPGGALLIRSWNRSAFLNITLPPALDVEFRLHSSKRPEFLVALGGNVREPLRVETWDNVLVLAAGDQFKIVRRIQDDEREIALRICWDPATHECSVLCSLGRGDHDVEAAGCSRCVDAGFRCAESRARFVPRPAARAGVGRKGAIENRSEGTARRIGGWAHDWRHIDQRLGGNAQRPVAGPNGRGQLSAQPGRCHRLLHRFAASSGACLVAGLQ